MREERERVYPGFNGWAFELSWVDLIDLGKNEEISLHSEELCLGHVDRNTPLTLLRDLNLLLPKRFVLFLCRVTDFVKGNEDEERSSSTMLNHVGQQAGIMAKASLGVAVMLTRP
ncbi:hypothetical protein TIFTF001_006376 [Ficus carica]|uniref:Uncharacterized protein n=1 Tax=Ficus carica TaxID=3494 RepID=A0AA87ZIP2_FICCA|nr:hypothetical protein TIFTF001_006376 [Ficus carica]